MLMHWGDGLQERKVEACRHSYICRDKHIVTNTMLRHVTRLVLHPLVLGCTVFDARNREPQEQPRARLQWLASKMSIALPTAAR